MKNDRCKKCFFCCILAVVISFIFAGCSIGGIKIIEKASPISNSSNNPKSSDPEIKTILTPASKVSSQVHTEIQYTSIPKKDYYVSTDTSLVDTPSPNAAIVENIKKGTKITVIGISSDKNYGAVQSKEKDNPEFILMSQISETPISSSSSSSSSNTKSSTTLSPTSQTSSQPSQIQSSISSATSSSVPESPTIPYISANSHLSSSNAPTSIPPQEQRIHGGISYPTNPSSTSKTLGITFANVNIHVVSINSTTINSGPGTLASGYHSLMTIPSGTRIRATGIGQNGYIRVSVNGNSGFISSDDLKICQ